MDHHNRESASNGASDAADLVLRLKPSVDATLERLAAKRFREDPIGGRKYSRATSIISSAYKRHGTLLEEAIVSRLSECPRLQVWREPSFKLSTQSLQICREVENTETLLKLDLPYGECEREIPLDMVVFDKEKRTLNSYNIKRGNGSYDAGKRRSIMTELFRTHLLLTSYGNALGFDVETSSALVIFYYGLKSVPDDLCIAGDELDDHFGFPVYQAVESVNDYFKNQLHALIEEE
ncbi:hypothetical protein [Ruegeria arenilitoris]|uniref:hypothetical protein n=1 Tax=Ruegeria arenilitoris TaxID=1173585 RepID=UPI00147E5381|nr:hypothetical protein [Ruegeria arenilitoris]